MTEGYIRARIIALEEKKELAIRCRCVLVVRRIQRELDELKEALKVKTS